jgi:hypothetical protein
MKWPGRGSHKEQTQSPSHWLPGFLSSLGSFVLLHPIPSPEVGTGQLNLSRAGPLAPWAPPLKGGPVSETHNQDRAGDLSGERPRRDRTARTERWGQREAMAWGTARSDGVGASGSGPHLPASQGGGGWPGTKHCFTLKIVRMTGLGSWPHGRLGFCICGRVRAIVIGVWGSPLSTVGVFPGPRTPPEATSER